HNTKLNAPVEQANGLDHRLWKTIRRNAAMVVRHDRKFGSRLVGWNICQAWNVPYDTQSVIPKTKLGLPNARALGVRKYHHSRRSRRLCAQPVQPWTQGPRLWRIVLVINQIGIQKAGCQQTRTSTEGIRRINQTGPERERQSCGSCAVPNIIAL